MSPGQGMGPGEGMGPGHGHGMGARSGTGTPATCSACQGPGPHCEQHFERIDTNQDGSVSEAEFLAIPHVQAHALSVFTSRDADQDAQLSKAEFCAPRGEPAQH